MDLLVADIGGTHVRLATVSREGVKLSLRHQYCYDTEDFNDFESALSDYLRQIDKTTPKYGAFAVAGPIEYQQCHLTNLNWAISASQLKNRFHFKECVLLNDLEAFAWGVASLTSDDLLVIQQGKADPQGNQCVLAPGTGLGEAGLICHQKQTIPFATEGGHCDFAATTEIEWQLFRYLNQQLPHVSWEHLLCGKGLEYIYQFLAHNSPSLNAPASRQAAEITAAARDNECTLCVDTVTLFSDLLAAEASNLALKIMATGGVFIAGTIPLKILPLIQRPGFIERFQDKGKMKHLIASMPVSVITNEQCALLGAARYAQHTWAR